MHAVRIINGAVWAGGKWLHGAALTAVDGRIVSLGAEGAAPEGARLIDAQGGYVVPGFIEAHMHGCGGMDFMDATPQAFDVIAKTASAHGVTAMAATTVACSESTLRRLFEAYRRAARKEQPLEYVGVHLEGPFLSQAMRGAQNPRYVRVPSPREVDALLDFGDGILVRCSAAPELEGAAEMAKRMRARGVALSVAHSDATCEQVLRAFDWGFTHLTHMYCNTPSVRKIGQIVHAGIVEAAYLLDGMTVELIGDGHHVPKELLKTAVKIKGTSRAMLITDAIRAAGTSVAESYLGEKTADNRVIIEDGVAKMPDRTYFAGSIATSDEMLRTMVLRYGLALEDAVRMMSETPARHLGIDGRKGFLATGMDADIVVLDKAYALRAVLSRGRVVAEGRKEQEVKCRELA